MQNTYSTWKFSLKKVLTIATDNGVPLITTTDPKKKLISVRHLVRIPLFPSFRRPRHGSPSAQTPRPTMAPAVYRDPMLRLF